MQLEQTVAEIKNQLDQQDELGIQITALNEVPNRGPTNKGVWNSIDGVTAVFADMKASTILNNKVPPDVAARAYTYFVRTTVVALDRFGADYLDIHGDGVFGLFSEGAFFQSVAAAITIKSIIQEDAQDRFSKHAPDDWDLTAGIGIDCGRLLVRRLGLRGADESEVWSGKPVNVAAKLSSVAKGDQVVASSRVMKRIEAANKTRRRAMLWTCGCANGTLGAGLNIVVGQTTELWVQENAPTNLGLDFEQIYRLDSEWCITHGDEFCEAILTGRRP